MDIESTLLIPRTDAAPERAAVPVARQNPPEPDAVAPVNQRSNLVRYTNTQDVLDEATKFQQHSGYDQPAGKGKQAIDTYLSHQREVQRDSIHQLLGVDIYA